CKVILYVFPLISTYNRSYNYPVQYVENECQSVTVTAVDITLPRPDRLAALRLPNQVLRRALRALFQKLLLSL
ncbi:TPA: hypothetical protein ACYSD8_004824, partial [Citrobacter freundii]